MVSLLKRQVSSKITEVLKSSSVIATDDLNTKLKIDYFTRVKRVDKSSSEFATFTINLKDLKKSKLISTERLNSEQNATLQNTQDELIESCKIENSKLLIKINLKMFKEKTLENLFNQNNSYGFQINKEQIYPKISKTRSDEWTLKNHPNNTVVEFSSPNIAKPLHAGHMRSTFLGNFLSKIHAKLNHNVTKINYLGDWGTQYGILAVGFKKYGSYEKLEESPIKHLLEVYVKANADESIRKEALHYFSQMEANDKESLEMWELFKNLSVKDLKEVYGKLDINFDLYEYESQYYVDAKNVVAKLLEHGVAQLIENNAVQVKVKNSQNNKDLKYIIQKQDGSSLYISRDIAALLARKKRFDLSKIIYVVDSSQRDHFLKLYETVKLLDSNLLNKISFEEFYVPFGRLTNMSTRRGKVEFLSDLINEAKLVALDSLESLKVKKDVSDIQYVAQNIGNSHLIISDMSRPRMKDYEFSWSNIVSKDDSAFMCHYAHARLYNLMEKCRSELKMRPSLEGVDLDLLNKNIELALIQHLARFEEVIWQSFQEYEPYHIVQYLFELVRLTNNCLKDNYVIGEDENVAKARLLLYSCSKQVINNAFDVIGITPLNRV